MKQFVRRVAGWRGIGDYPGTSSYTLRELVKRCWPRRDHTSHAPCSRDPTAASFTITKGSTGVRCGLRWRRGSIPCVR